MSIKAVRFAATFAALYAAHHVGDYWVQTDRQAVNKGKPGAEGRKACAAHVGTYTATTALAVLGMDRATGLRTHPWAFLAGQAFSAATHYAADRRDHGLMMRLVDRLGKSQYARERGGAPFLDQAWHIAALAGTALVVTALSGGDA